MNSTEPVLDDQVTKGRFRDRVVIVTGGASGIGKATVDRFVNDGAKHVAIFDLDGETGTGVAASLDSSEQRVTFHCVDVADKAQCSKEVDEVAKQNGGVIHHLVNNAAYFEWKGLDSEHEGWRRMMTVNVEGYSNMVQACFQFMLKGNDCTVVNVGSNCAHRAQANRWTYSASKGAIVSLTKCMALDLGSHGIRVNCISPGCVWTSANVRNVPEDKHAAMKKFYDDIHILRRTGYPREIAAAITFLSSRDASFFTGADVPVDGGHGVMSAEKYGFKR